MVARTLKTSALDKALSASAATAEFKQAVLAYAEGKADAALIKSNAGAPPVKILRVITQLLVQYPREPIEAVQVDGASGCSDFRGTLKVRGGSVHTINFVWDCAWKAEQAGYKTFWGEPDQQKAAAEFGYDCFEVFAPAT
jgi:hypothetical protein